MIDERHSPLQFHFLTRVVMSPESYNGLRAVDRAGVSSLAPGDQIKALIERDGRTCWHVVEIERAHGMTFYFASEIVVRAYQAE